LGGKLAQFVPAHPIAGAERSGVDAATASLFQDRLVVLTPLPETAPEACSRVEAAWRLCGARLAQMDPLRHDQVFAAVSHLPHALAFALVSMIAARPDAPELFSFAGAGFRDFTRIAGSSPEMWRDICMANRDVLLQEIDAFQGALSALSNSIRDGDAAGVERVFKAARDARSRWLQRS
jgi:prephenate dehydrogenase